MEGEIEVSDDFTVFLQDFEKDLFVDSEKEEEMKDSEKKGEKEKEKSKEEEPRINTVYANMYIPGWQHKEQEIDWIGLVDENLEEITTRIVADLGSAKEGRNVLLMCFQKFAATHTVAQLEPYLFRILDIAEEVKIHKILWATAFFIPEQYTKWPEVGYFNRRVRKMNLIANMPPNNIHKVIMRTHQGKMAIKPAMFLDYQLYCGLGRIFSPEALDKIVNNIVTVFTKSFAEEDRPKSKELVKDWLPKALHETPGFRDDTYSMNLMKRKGLLPYFNVREDGSDSSEGRKKRLEICQEWVVYKQYGYLPVDIRERRKICEVQAAKQRHPLGWEPVSTAWVNEWVSDDEESTEESDEEESEMEISRDVVELNDGELQIKVVEENKNEEIGNESEISSLLKDLECKDQEIVQLAEKNQELEDEIIEECKDKEYWQGKYDEAKEKKFYWQEKYEQQCVDAKEWKFLCQMKMEKIEELEVDKEELEKEIKGMAKESKKRKISKK